MGDVPTDNKKLGTILDDAIKLAFAFPFSAGDHSAPDNSKHIIPDRTFHLDEYFIVLHTVRLFPGLTFRAFEANAGELEALTQDVKFEIDIPLIGGFFYAITGSENDTRKNPIKGTFKIDFDSAIAKGIAYYYLKDNGSVPITNLVLDYELMEKAKVTFYPKDDGDSLGPLDSDTAGPKVAEIFWPTVYPVIHSVLQEHYWTVCTEIPVDPFDPHKIIRPKVTDLLAGIIAKVKRALRKKLNGGRYRMPDINVMVAPMHSPAAWGRFKATSGWLENVASMRIMENAVIHVRSQNEIVMVGAIGFNDWRYYYDEYTLKTNHCDITGEVIRSFCRNDGFIEITTIRTVAGKMVHHGRLEYMYTTKPRTEITRHEYHHADWLTAYVPLWMSGAMEEEKPALNKIINDCLNEVLVDFDVFACWEEIKNTPTPEVSDKKKHYFGSYEPDENCSNISEDDSAVVPIFNNSPIIILISN